MNWDSCKIKKPPLDTPATRTRQIKEKARTLGFLDCGIVRAGELTEDARRLRTWLELDFHGDMQYMQNHFEKRADPRRLVEDACSVIVVLQNYFSPDTPHDPEAPLVSRYAYGKDYHRLVRKKLKNLLSFMDSRMGAASGRYFVDSAHVLERAWGREAGLGWIGKNSLLLNRRNGSYFFIGVIITALELEYDTPTKDYCGDCTRCIDACPTQAILPGKVVDSKRCISYLTIEYKKDTLPEEFMTSGESLVRNLLIGHKTAERSGKVMKVGYTPTSCGQISQLPLTVLLRNLPRRVVAHSTLCR